MIERFLIIILVVTFYLSESLAVPFETDDQSAPPSMTTARINNAKFPTGLPTVINSSSEQILTHWKIQKDPVKSLQALQG